MKFTFEADTFESWTFRSGHWTGIGTDSTAKGGTWQAGELRIDRCEASEFRQIGAIATQLRQAGSKEGEVRP